MYLSFIEVNISLIREGGITTSRMKSWTGIMRLTVAKRYFRFCFQWRARFASSSDFLHVFNSNRDRTVLSSRAIFHRYYQSETQFNRSQTFDMPKLGLWAASSSLQSLQNKRYWCDHYRIWRDTREEILMSNIQKRIRFVNSDGPLVPMLVLEPIGKDVIPMVLWIRISLRGLWLFSQFRWSIDTTGTIDTNRNAI